MARRFTDTEKWDDPWYSELSPDEKLIYNYINDKCSHSGIYKPNFKYIRFHCGSEKTNDEILELLQDRIYQFDDKWLLPKFIKYQYPKGLQSDKPAIVSVRRELNSFGLSEIIKQLLPNDYLIIKDKDIDIDKTRQKKRKLDTKQIKRIMQENYSDPKYVLRPSNLK